MTSLFFDIEKDQWPIIYHEKYNISFMGLEKMHVFDAKKWGNIIRLLKEKNIIEDCCFVTPKPAKVNDLLYVHTCKYLNSLRWSLNVAVIAEIPLLACVPNYFVQKAFLKPMRYQVGGTVLAGKLALERGWAINIGGGLHHCSSTRGGGFCAYADISLMILFLLREKLIQTAMIVDLDAHQGNGYERDFRKLTEVYIMDMYNKNIYPKDRRAKKAIRQKVELENLVEDLEYMVKLKKHLKLSFDEFEPDIVVYNAGTDVLKGDPLGRLSITAEGIIERDQIVFDMCKEKSVPIVMLTSGGYLKATANIIANSIHNLYDKQLIKGTSIVKKEMSIMDLD